MGSVNTLLKDLLLLWNNDTHSITEDYLPCARMIFTMSLERKDENDVCAKGALKGLYRVN